MPDEFVAELPQEFENGCICGGKQTSRGGLAYGLRIRMVNKGKD